MMSAGARVMERFVIWHTIVYTSFSNVVAEAEHKNSPVQQMLLK